MPTGKLRVFGLGIQGSMVRDLVLSIAGLTGVTLFPGVRNEWRAYELWMEGSSCGGFLLGKDIDLELLRYRLDK